MTYARSIAQRSFRASVYALTRRARLLHIELLLIEIDCLQVWLAGRSR